MMKKISIFIYSVLIIFFLFDSVHAQQKKKKKEDDGVRIKDMARISGIRTNQLIGYGVVIGLSGTGDARSRLSKESMDNLLANLGHRMDEDSGTSKNIAAVIITAELPPFARKGDRVDVTVASIGDARSIEGGVLVQTPLRAGNGSIYAAAQGSVSSGGKDEERASSQGKTVGHIMGGAVIEKEVESSYSTERKIRIHLNHFDFATLSATQDKIKETIKDIKTSIDGGSIIVEIPEHTDLIATIGKIEELRVKPMYRSRIVINERTGTIVIGGDVRIDPVAVSRGRMKLTIRPGQKMPDAMGIKVSTEEDKRKNPPSTFELSASNVSEVIDKLNSMGAGIQDIISILEALKDSGALHAELIVL